MVTGMVFSGAVVVLTVCLNKMVFLINGCAIIAPITNIKHKTTANDLILIKKNNRFGIKTNKYDAIYGNGYYYGITEAVDWL